MRTIADLITEWLGGHPSRSAASLARHSGVSAAEISLIMKGRVPSVMVAARLGAVLPEEEVLAFIFQADPTIQKFFSRILSRHKEAV